MNCIIVDDESTARTIIKKLCTHIEGLLVLEEFSDALGAIKFLNKTNVDVIFLDIHMPDFTGFDFIQTIKNPPLVVLTTSDPQFAIEAFEYDCIVDYLVKPILLPRFEKAITKVKTFQKKLAEEATVPQELKEQNLTEVADKKSSDKDLYVNIDRRLIKIDIPSIYLVEAKGDYINIKTEEKNYFVHSTLKKIEDKLPDNLFLKVHRSFIINVTKIIDIEDNSVLIKKDVVPVSRSNRPELIKRLNLL